MESDAAPETLAAGPPAAPSDGAGLDLDAVAEDLSRVETALERLDAGEYGLCTRCGAPIADEVLAAAPTATACTAHLPDI